MYYILELELSLPHRDDPIKMAGEVCWIREAALEKIGPPGIGVKFIEIAEQDIEEIETFLRKRAPILGGV